MRYFVVKPKNVDGELVYDIVKEFSNLQLAKENAAVRRRHDHTDYLVLDEEELTGDAYEADEDQDTDSPD